MICLPLKRSYHLFIIIRVTEREGKEREIFHSLSGSFSNNYKSQDWVRSRSGASSGSPMWVAGTQIMQAIFYYLFQVINRGLGWNYSTQMGCQCHKQGLYLPRGNSGHDMLIIKIFETEAKLPSIWACAFQVASTQLYSFQHSLRAWCWSLMLSGAGMENWWCWNDHGNLLAARDASEEGP